MSAQHNGGPAFPAVHLCDDHNGMTLLDYFAAKAMQGLVAGSGNSNGQVVYDEARIARSAYEMADAMLHMRHARQMWATRSPT